MSENGKKFKHEGERFVLEYMQQSENLSLYEKRKDGSLDTIFKSVPLSALKKLWERTV